MRSKRFCYYPANCWTTLASPPPTQHAHTFSYAPKFQILQRAILALMPAATVTGATGRSSSFEVLVTVGEGEPVQVYSKLSTGAFPAFDALAKSIVDSAK